MADYALELVNGHLRAPSRPKQTIWASTAQGVQEVRPTFALPGCGSRFTRSGYRCWKSWNRLDHESLFLYELFRP